MPTATRKAKWSGPITGWPRPDKRPSPKVDGVFPPIRWWADAGVIVKRNAGIARKAVRRSEAKLM
jgi:hypothetical protein